MLAALDCSAPPSMVVCCCYNGNARLASTVASDRSAALRVVTMLFTTPAVALLAIALSLSLLDSTNASSVRLQPPSTRLATISTTATVTKNVASSLSPSPPSSSFPLSPHSLPPTSLLSQKKRGLSGLSAASCGDAAALGLRDSWAYNWRLYPDGAVGGGPHGEPPCKPLQTREFVPMVWGCGNGGDDNGIRKREDGSANCTSEVTGAVRAIWAQSGVSHLLGFNEPDNSDQSNLSPLQAALYWPQLDSLAASFSPPLRLVGPGMTHWDTPTGGSSWLDQFLGNLTRICPGCPARIVALAQHDYGGNAESIVARAEAAHTHYGRPIWLTEFSVGSGANRSRNDAFAKQVLPLLEASPHIQRYAWFSTRNAPASWVNESSLLPPIGRGPGSWTRQGDTTCANMTQLIWISQHGNLGNCLAMTVGNDNCALPKRAIYQNGDVQNCYCAAVPSCTTKSSSWQNMYTQENGPGAPWAKIPHRACNTSVMAWLGQHATALGCQTEAMLSPQCGTLPSRQVFYEAGDVQNCYCRNTTGEDDSCTLMPSTWLDTYTQPPPPPPDMRLTSTGKLYAEL